MSNKKFVAYLKELLVRLLGNQRKITKSERVKPDLRTKFQNINKREGFPLSKLAR
jgi:hypothetical protein